MTSDISLDFMYPWKNIVLVKELKNVIIQLLNPSWILFYLFIF